MSIIHFWFTLPNFLSMLRVVLLPVIVYFFLSGGVFKILISVLLFLIASSTDFFDGAIARRFHQTSDFGAFFDPLADKILVWGVYSAIIFKLNLSFLWIFLGVIVFRDVLVTFLRSYSKIKGWAFKTSFIAKVKTAVQMIFAFFIMCYYLIVEWIKTYFASSRGMLEFIRKGEGGVVILPTILIIICALFTVYSGVDYILEIFRRSSKS